MMYKDKIKQLCQEQTNLDEADIEHLVQEADELLKNSAYANEDVFIDVKNIFSEHAIVIFHKKPESKLSLYENSVVGAMAYLENEPGVIRTLETGAPSIGLSARSQEGLAIHQTVFPIVREERVIGTLIIERNAPQTLPDHFSLDKEDGGFGLRSTPEISAQEQFVLFDHIDEACLVFDQQGYLKYFNQAAADSYRHKLGYMDSIEGMHYSNLVLDSLTFEEIQQLGPQAPQEKPHQVEVHYGTYCFLVKRYLLAESENVVMICKDITDIKEKEVQLLTHTTTIREMNHRVKNNLQTVVSLLRLQAQQSPGADTKKALNDSMNRVLSIAATHELLSSQQDDSIQIEHLLKRVIENVQRCFSGHREIVLTYSLEPELCLDSSRATSLALIVNELLQNSYEHAFKDKKNPEKPQIRLQVGLKNDIITLKVLDNGSGYNQEHSFENHLGLLLVERFVQGKLFGTLSIHSDHEGTATTIRFKK
ncbi:histidine kinase N-terminal domain-containing protein [uncultured Streptococcus sp.]|uniref:histidine kinase N-terminal domain-containing protein n=1 Tax=uncultured Streptococcus sp. TaxID=83427 RepID=UPI0028D27251|nr:histidine kinase N-terminal domain-containing protein [uncultured Streptococcus sp.]